MTREKLLMLIGSVCLALVLAVPLVMACAGPAPSPTPSPTPTQAPTPTPSPPPGAETFDWKMSNLYPRAGLPVTVAEDFENKVFAMSDGRLKITNYYAGELVGEIETLQSVISGLAEVGFVYNAAYAGLIPAAQIEMGLPAVNWNTLEQQEWFWEYEGGAAGKILRDAYAEQGIFWVNFGNQCAPLLASKEPINSVDELVGMKVRAWGIVADFMDKIGAKATSVAFDELYTAMATGVVDAGAGFNMVDYHDAKLYEPCPYLFPLRLSGTNGGPIVVNLDSYNSLPDDLKVILEVAARDNCWYNSRAFGYYAVSFWEEMKAAGAQDGPALSQADRDKWMAAGLELWDDYAKKDKYCGELIPLMKGFLTEMGLV